MATNETTGPAPTEPAQAGSDGSNHSLREVKNPINGDRLMPSWAMRPFKAFVLQVERLEQIVNLTRSAIPVLLKTPDMLALIHEVEENPPTTEDLKKLEFAKEQAQLAKREIEEDFPVLHAFAVVALWSALEALVRVCVIRMLEHHKPAMEHELVRKLKVRIGDYERLEGEDRFAYVVDRLEEELAAPLRNGVTRFETILAPFGLSGSVGDDLKRDIFELGQVRNVLVHRSGVADRRLSEACPWLAVRVGERLTVSHQALGKYFLSVEKYMAALLIRLGEQLGRDMTRIRIMAESLFDAHSLPLVRASGMPGSHDLTQSAGASTSDSPCQKGYDSR